MDRIGSFRRETKETDITLELNLDGKGIYDIKTGIGFFDHMLSLFAAHGSMDLKLKCSGDLVIDGHHSIEDCGIVLGKAFAKALGDRKSIKRYSTVFVPMDESLAMVSLDISGRSYLHCEVPEMAPMVGNFDTQLLEEFLRSFSLNAGITLHVRVLYGKNTHHIIEAIFKAMGRALREAVTIDANVEGVPSTKGVLD